MKRYITLILVLSVTMLSGCGGPSVSLLETYVKGHISEPIALVNISELSRTAIKGQFVNKEAYHVKVKATYEVTSDDCSSSTRTAMLTKIRYSQGIEAARKLASEKSECSFPDAKVTTKKGTQYTREYSVVFAKMDDGWKVFEVPRAAYSRF